MKPLPDYTEQELRDEMHLRYQRQRSGLCDYCGKLAGKPPVCNYPERHNRKGTQGMR